ncbi:eCIS core domain-containing protein, partial [Nostoc sp.]|uniref:eCIS core domain-containing protein n=1 Tax=Nostoc sp. TaxID=1180 RepID=UPI002FFAC99C
QEVPEDEEELQMKSLDNSTLQRQEVPEDEEELQMKSMVQRQAKAGMPAAPDLEASINQARGGGVAIADNIREPMEQAFGADFSGVKVHTDGQSDQLNRSIQARAFTTGQDVFFRSGEYNPGSRGGQELLAHELTHVVQQGGKTMLQKRDYNPNPVPAAEIALTAHHVIPHSNLEKYKDHAIAKEFIPNKDKVTLEQLVNIHLLPKLNDLRGWGQDYSKHGAMTAKDFLNNTKIRNTSKDEKKDYNKVLTAINKIDEAKTEKKRNTDLNQSEKEEITGSFFLWSPANIFIGPSPQLRDWDPGSDGLDTDAQYFLAQDQYALLNQTYELMQQQGEDRTILKNFSKLATNYNKVTSYEPRKWRTIKPSNKYCPSDRQPRAY